MTEFANPISLFNYHLAHGWSGVSRPLGEVFAAQRREEYALAALKGGDTSMGDTQSAVRERFRVQRADAANLAIGGAKALSAKFAKIADDCLRIDPAEVAAISPTLALGLADAELARLASDNRNSLGALRAIAAQNCAYSRALKRALDGFAEAVQAVPEKTLAFAQRAATGQNDVSRTRDADLLRGLIEEKIAAVDAAWEHLNDAVAGEAKEDFLVRAFDQAANQ